MAQAKPLKKRRLNEIKVRFSDEELELAEKFERLSGKQRAVYLRELYMDKVKTLLAGVTANNHRAA